MDKLKVKIEFDCLANKEETEEQLNKIVNYQIYEKIWNVDSNKGVKLTVTKEKNNELKRVKRWNNNHKEGFENH